MRNDKKKKNGDVFLGLMDDLTKLAMIPIIIISIAIIWTILFR